MGDRKYSTARNHPDATIPLRVAETDRPEAQKQKSLEQFGARLTVRRTKKATQKATSERHHFVSIYIAESEKQSHVKGSRLQPCHCDKREKVELEATIVHDLHCGTRFETQKCKKIIAPATKFAMCESAMPATVFRAAKTLATRNATQGLQSATPATKMQSRLFKTSQK